MTIFKPKDIAVLCLEAAFHKKAREISQALSVPLRLENAGPELNLVVISHDHLALRTISSESTSDLIVDFVGGKVGHRRRQGEGKNQPLAKAVGVKNSNYPTVLDLTAGLGRDAFFLATLGCDVTLVERSPFVFLVLDDGLKRACEDEETREIVERMHWYNRQSIEYLQNLKDDLPEVIYMDPMYPHRQKTALVKKEMRIIRSFVGDDEDIVEVFNLAREKARKRVVIKRPKTARPLIEERVNFTVESKNTRYDVYLPVNPVD